MKADTSRLGYTKLTGVSEGFGQSKAFLKKKKLDNRQTDSGSVSSAEKATFKCKYEPVQAVTPGSPQQYQKSHS